MKGETKSVERFEGHTLLLFNKSWLFQYFHIFLNLGDIFKILYAIFKGLYFCN